MFNFAVALTLISLWTPAAAAPVDPVGDILPAFGVNVSPPVGSPLDALHRGARARRSTVVNRKGPAEPAVRASARAAGVPEALAVTVAASESGNACSPAGSRYKGPLQVSAATARGLGYRGNEAGLNSCGSGLFYGMKHLAKCFKLAHGNPTRTIACHRRGFGAIR